MKGSQQERGRSSLEFRKAYYRVYCCCIPGIYLVVRSLLFSLFFFITGTTLSLQGSHGPVVRHTLYGKYGFSSLSRPRNSLLFYYSMILLLNTRVNI